MFTWRAIALLLALALVAAACGNGGGDETAAAGEGEDFAALEPEALISAEEGGSVGLPDGSVQLDVPPGALAEDTTISVSRVKRADYPEELDPSDGRIGEVYEFEPDGLEFEQPATVTIRSKRSSVEIDDGQVQMGLLLSRSSDGEWEVLDNPATEANLSEERRSVTAELTHFSRVVDIDSDIVLVITPKSVEVNPPASWTAEVGWSNGGTDTVEVLESEWTATGSVTAGDGFVPMEAMSPGDRLRASNEFSCQEGPGGTFGLSIRLGIQALDLGEALAAALAGQVPGRLSVHGDAVCNDQVTPNIDPTTEQDIVEELPDDCYVKGRGIIGDCGEAPDATALTVTRFSGPAQAAVDGPFGSSAGGTDGAKAATGVLARAAGAECEGILVTYTVEPAVEELNPAMQGEAAMQVHPEGASDSEDAGVGMSYRGGAWSLFAFDRSGPDPAEGTFAGRAEGNTIAFALESYGDGSCILDSDEMRVKIQMERGPLDERVYDLALEGLMEYAPISAFVGG